MSQFKKTFWNKLLPVSGLIILCFLISRIGISNIENAFKEIHLGPLIFIPIFLALLYVVQAIKWQYLLQKQGIDVKFGVVFRANLVGTFYGAITPGRAGFLLKIRYLAKYYDRSKTEISSSVIVDKLLELLVLSLFAACGSIIFIKNFGPSLFYAAVAMVLVFAFFLLTFLRTKVIKYLIHKMIQTVIPEVHQDNMQEYFNRVFSTFPEKKFLVVPFLLSVCNWLLLWSQAFIIATALSISISYSIFIFIIPIGSLVALIPITVSGIGTKEAALAGLFSVYGIAPEKTVVMSLLTVLLCVYVPAVIGLIQIRFFSKAEAIENNKVTTKTSTKTI